LGYGYGTTSNNGNIQSQDIVINTSTTISPSYTYDQVNRLLTATEGATWSQNYSYDQYGNRAVTGYIINSALTPQGLSAFNAATNRIIASSYDTSGNQTQNQAGRFFAYDAENHQTNFNNGVGTCSYDCDGRRVKKTDSTGTTVFVYDVATRKQP